MKKNITDKLLDGLYWGFLAFSAIATMVVAYKLFF